MRPIELTLSIDPSPYQPNASLISPDSPYTSSSSARPSSETATTSPSSSGSESLIYSVLCMHDFLSDDPIHLSFSKNEILDVIKQEGSGWWAAMRRGADIVGWIPQAFVKPLTEEMTERLWNVREELRVYEYEAEQLCSGPYEEPESSPSKPRDPRQEISYPKVWKNDEISPDQHRPYPPPSPATPMPQPPPPYSTNKPTPPTPTEDTSISPQDRGTPSSIIRRPLPPITTLSESSSGNDSSISPDAKRRDEKIRKLTGSVEALLFHNAVLVQANPPWYLKPRHAEDIRTDTDGKLISGTRIALVERLVWDTIPSQKDTRKAAQDTAYRRMFLMTFRTFMSPDELFDMLVEMYRMSYPENLTESEFVEWRERCLHPTQCMVLTVFTMWLEEHRLLEEEPHISRRLIEFLALIKPPSPLTVTAQSIIQSITRLTFATNTTTTTSPHSRRKRRAPKNDLSSFQPSDLAEQLSLHEFKLYSKITPQDCIAQATQSPKPGCPKARESLSAFCATHDKLAVWVTDTILSSQQLSGRSNTVDFWIKVAEKCRNLNNFASMSAIINALSSTVISRLNLTWLHVGRKNTLETLLKFNEPSGGFSGYRRLHLHAEGSCVPFIGMYMTDLVHIKDQYADEDGRVSILQRQRWYEVVLIMLRSQSKPYNFAENEVTMNFIQNNLRGITTTKEWQAKFWSKSQEVQRSEVAHTDIRKGLERAGF